MTSKLQFKRVGQVMNNDDIDKLYQDLTSTVNSLPDTFKDLREQLRTNLQGINTLNEDRKKLLEDKAIAQKKINDLDKEIQKLENNKTIISNAGKQFDQLINQVQKKLELPV